MIQTIDIVDFLDNSMLSENSFREKIRKVDWQSYLNKKVIIKGCDKIPIPTWAYLVIVSELSQFASRIYFGEPCNAILIHKRSA